MSTWGGTDNATGEIYLVEGATGATGPGRVTYQQDRRRAAGAAGRRGGRRQRLRRQKHELTALRDTDGDGVADDRRTVATWPFGGNFHEFAFGLLYRDGYFHLNLSVAINQGGATTEPQPAAEPGHHHQGRHARTGDDRVRRRWPAHPERDRLGAGRRHLRHRQPGWLAALVEAGARSSRAGSSTTTPTPTGRSTTSRSPGRCSGCRRTRSPTPPAPRCCSKQGPFAGQMRHRRRHLRRPAAGVPGEGQG